MADYDLVIIGGSLAGRYAASRAIEQNKKVALIEPEETTLFNLLLPHALSQLRQVKQQFFIPPNYQISLSWAEARQWIKNVIANIEKKHSLTVLAALGVDVIVGNAEFSRQQLLIKVNSRKLNAHSYLIATGTIPKDGLETQSYFTLANIGQQLDVTKVGKNWVVIGGNPDSITWAQILNRLGFNVSLIVKSSQVLSSLDADTSYLVQAILEADGVKVLTDTSISQIKEIDGKKWIQAGNEAIETDEILAGVGYEPNIKNLQLEAVNVKWHRRGIDVNSWLQTTNPQVYACGDVIGGYSGANISNYEAKIAVNNALLLPKLKVNYQSIPWGTYTSPQIAQVGFTENKATQIYDDVVVLPHYFKEVAAAQLKEETTGILKIVIRRNGEILGATIISSQAAELINIMALAIAQKLKIEAISHLFPLYPSFAEIFTFGR